MLRKSDGSRLVPARGGLNVEESGKVCNLRLFHVPFMAYRLNIQQILPAKLHGATANRTLCVKLGNMLHQINDAIVCGHILSHVMRTVRSKCATKRIFKEFVMINQFFNSGNTNFFDFAAPAQ
jgi:hypothetical protein